MVFADNGPGIRPDDVPYIFEPFYSGKGEEGRGLGMYIARQLLERKDYTIEGADKSERLRGGAKLVVSFVKRESKLRLLIKDCSRGLPWTLMIKLRRKPWRGVSKSLARSGGWGGTSSHRKRGGREG